jgi:N-succinyl-L-ornithine transcarbamylase|tara:strand:- start:1816 stop:2751 length:936 start_codon:yes stop_codon:yes gene_type:complete
MKHYLTLNDLTSIETAIQEAMALKSDPYKYKYLGAQKTLVMLFFNASLRTRLSTEKAAKHLGMEVIVLNVTDSWQLEFEAGVVMNLESSEHVKEAAQVISQYADILAVRAFPSLKNKEKDQSEWILTSFVKYATVPVVNMESATGHPLQALADAITIEELKTKKTPKVVLSWAPHPKALPHAVANSFIEMMQASDVNFSIVHPQGYDLDPNIVKETPVSYLQDKALESADFVYVKNWSNYQAYGEVTSQDASWMMTKQKLGSAIFMHCLPVRRNVVVEDAVLDSEQSAVIMQSNNRTYAAQLVLKKILENG